MRHIWLNKRLYEGLPFAYMGAGVAWLIAGLLVGSARWSLILTLLGLICLTGGLVVLLKRRDYRASRSRSAFDEQA